MRTVERTMSAHTASQRSANCSTDNPIAICATNIEKS
jgi:hypothetical protein